MCPIFLRCLPLRAVLIVVLNSEDYGRKKWQPAVLIVAAAQQMKFLMTKWMFATEINPSHSSVWVIHMGLIKWLRSPIHKSIISNTCIRYYKNVINNNVPLSNAICQLFFCIVRYRIVSHCLYCVNVYSFCCHILANVIFSHRLFVSIDTILFLLLLSLHIWCLTLISS